MTTRPKQATQWTLLTRRIQPGVRNGGCWEGLTIDPDVTPSNVTAYNPMTNGLNPIPVDAPDRANVAVGQRRGPAVTLFQLAWTIPNYDAN